MCSVEKHLLSGKMHCFILILFGLVCCGLSLGINRIYSKEFYLTKSPKNFKNDSDYSLDETFQCTSDLECQSFIMESQCVNKCCKCTKDKFLSSDASKCLSPVKEFGSDCEDNVQCSNRLSSGGICDEKERKCFCKSGYHYLKGSCWKNVNLNEKCFTNEQCYAAYENVGLECTSVCKCRKNYYQRLNSGCRRLRQLGQSCNLDTDCEIEQVCEGMKCKGLNVDNMVILPNTTAEKIWKVGNCSKGMFEVEGECFRELGMPCTQDSECSHIKGATCLDNKVCACEPALSVASENNRNCLRAPRAKVDDIYKTLCTSDVQCGVFGNSICLNKRCACKNETYFETKNKFCWEIKPLQENCSVDEDCHPAGTHAECNVKEKKCLCKSGYHQKGSNCVLDALVVGDSCDDDKECLFPNSFCNSSKVCACRKQHYPENGKCKPGVGTVCVKDEDCEYLNNTNCIVGKDLPLKQCLCMENHINSNDYKYCLPIANHKQTCLESFQCEYSLGELGHCKNQICECREGTHFSYGKCHESKSVGETCTKRTDCFPGNDINSVICLKGFCACNYDYELDKTGVCVKTNSATTIKFYSGLLTTLVLFLTTR